MKPVGLTKDAGWQIGVSRTLDAPIDAVWTLLTSPEGLRIWLGRGELPDDVRSNKRHDRIRLGAEDGSIVQVAVRDVGDGRTKVTLHQERLRSGEEREARRAHWRAVMDRLQAELG